MGRDIYADLEKIEERGKRKKKGFLSFMGGSKEPGEEPPPVHTVSAFSSKPAKASSATVVSDQKLVEPAAPELQFLSHT